MKHHCPRCGPKQVLIRQPAKIRFFCKECKCNFTRLEVAFIKGAKYHEEKTTNTPAGI